jgi:thiol-disulfide isomerase/thioredoxin
MKSSFIKEKINPVWKITRPWIITIALLLILRYTGLLAGISQVTGTLLLKTGAMNASTESPLVAKTFDYNFKIKDLDGNVIDFNNFKGKTIFLNIWATWCGPCRVEMPSIQKLYEKADKDNVVFVMLAVDERGHFEKVVNYIRDKQFTFPVYVPHEFLPEQLMVRTIPTTIIIDGKGKIEARETGAANYDTEKFLNFLQKLASENEDTSK